MWVPSFLNLYNYYMMKKYLSILLLITTCIVHAEEKLESIFNAANRKYNEAQYDSAIQLYQTIKSRGYESAAMYYNIGNAWFKLRQYPKSILNYERALLIEPGNKNVLYNIAKARMYNVDKIDEIPEFVIKHWSDKAINILSSNSWAIISLVSFVFGLSLFLVYFLSMSLTIKKTAFYAAFFILFGASVSFLFSYKAKSMIVKNNGAIVMSSTVTVRSSPQTTGTNLFVIHEGTKVYVVGQLDNWYEIRLGDGKQGWLLTSDIEII
jgi:tetratricopeptide (TPR) repeat protein